MIQYQNYSSLGVNLNRQKYGPLDISSVFASQADLTYYLAKGAVTANVSAYWLGVVPYPYEGQIVALVTNEGATAYIITQWNAETSEYDVEPVGSGTVTVDDASVEVDSNGEIKLKNYGDHYYHYVPAHDDVPASYVLTQGFISGLEPRVANVGGSLVIEWYEPSSETIEGVSARLSNAEQDIDNLEQDVSDLQTLLQQPIELFGGNATGWTVEAQNG